MKTGGLLAKAPFNVLEKKAFLASKYLVHNLRTFSAKAAAKTTVFVAGHQRSGTNMLMDILERSYETEVYHERDSRAFDNYRMRELPVIRDLQRASQSPYFILKALCELQDLPELMAAFPPAYTLWLVRDYRDVVNSAVRSFPDFARYARLLADDPEAAGWRGQGMSRETRSIVRSVVHPEITETSAAALQWYVRNTLFFERGLDRDPRVRVIHYENLVQNPQAEFAGIFQFLKLKYAPWMGKDIFGTSVGKHREPDIDAPIRALCEEMMTRFHAWCPLGMGSS
jgi:hypothetical protein